MRSPRTILLTLLLALAAQQAAYTQTWEPSARLWGWGMNKYNWVQVGDGITRVHLYSPQGGGVYDLSTLAPDMPVIDGLHGLGSIREKGDVNGNGITDIMGRRTDDNNLAILLDAFTEQERFIPFPVTAAGNAPVGRWNDRGTLEDLDFDDLNDAYTDNEVGGYSVISYGDPDAPLTQQSVVPYTNAETPYAKAVCLGTLEGKACMLRITWWWVPRGNDSTQMWAYTLDVLNEQDLRERRDTIRYETVQRYDVGSYGWAYRDCFIIFDDVWQLTHFNPGGPCLRVQLSGIEEHKPDSSFMMSDGIIIGHGTVFGQARAQRDNIVRVDGREPFIGWLSGIRLDPDTSYQVNYAELLQISDPHTLETRNLGRMGTAYTERDHGGREAACTTPDIDGDGIGEVLLYYHATSPITGKQERLVDLFLTRDRPTTGVESSEQRAESTECDLSGDVVRIYNVLGEQIATLPLSTRGTIAPSDLEALPMQPLWAVSGKCVKRIR